MPKLTTPLTDIQPRNAKPKAKPYKLGDGGGLFLLINPDSSKYWRFMYRFSGVQKTLAFGKYPEVSLADARKLRQEAKIKVNNGIDPSQAKRIEKQLRATTSANTFEAVALEWHTNKLDTWQTRTAENILHRLKKDVFPIIGKYPITEIKAPVVLDVLRQIELRGAFDMAKRQNQVIGQIFKFAIATGKMENNPAAVLSGALKITAKGHHAAITVDELPVFLRDFDKIEGRMFVPTRVMFRLMMMIFVRTSELTETPWSEIDLENESWVSPNARVLMQVSAAQIQSPTKSEHHQENR